MNALVVRAGDWSGVSSLTRHRRLIWEMAKREHRDRYAGSMLGLLWAVGHPLALMIVYIFVFSLVFKVRMGGTADMPLDYAAYLMAGYLPWMAFQESMIKAASSIASNASLVKQVVFPIEVLPTKGAVAAVLTQLIGTALLVTYVLVRHHSAAWTYLLFPALLGLQLLAMTGVSMTLGGVGAYFRDVRDVVQVACLVGAYFTPVFYPPEWVPAVVRPVLYLNPFSYIAWCYQDVFYFGRIAHPVAWVVFAAGALALFQLGLGFFGRVKVYFGNVL
jgi:lipopolysaccharide transport system permease protein